MSGMLAEQHLFNLDGSCTTHKGACKVELVSDSSEDSVVRVWNPKALEMKKTRDARRSSIPTIGNLMRRNRELLLENVRCNERNSRQSLYIQELQVQLENVGVAND